MEKLWVFQDRKWPPLAGTLKPLADTIEQKRGQSYALFQKWLFSAIAMSRASWSPTLWQHSSTTQSLVFWERTFSAKSKITSGSKGAWRTRPPCPHFFSKSWSFQAIIRKQTYFEEYLGSPLGSNLCWPSPDQNPGCATENAQIYTEFTLTWKWNPGRVVVCMYVRLADWPQVDKRLMRSRMTETGRTLRIQHSFQSLSPCRHPQFSKFSP